MMIHIPGEDVQLPFHSPSKFCCNCGTHSDLAMEEAKFRHTRYMVVAGTELTFTLPLPFCKECKRTANRVRQGLLSKALITFGLFWVFIGLLMIVPAEKLPALIKERLPLASIMLACLFTAAFYGLRKPSGSKTSFYQPVFLGKLKQSFRGEIKGMTLCFTNRSYAEQFRATNQAWCNAGTLVVEVV